MSNQLVTPPKLKTIRPQIKDVYFARKTGKTGTAVFEKIEEGVMETKCI